MKRLLMNLTGCFLLGVSVYAQNGETQITKRLTDYFATYQTSYTSSSDRCRIEKVKVNGINRTVDIYLNEVFAGQSFDNKKVQDIYRNVKRLLPTPYNTYHITVYGKQVPIDSLVTDIHLDESSSMRKKWGGLLYRGYPWVERTQRPHVPTKGLQQRHLSVWASHGRYYKNDKKEWTWQRPYLYCTTEDLFTQTIVIPFLIPMLEKAGAYVFTPRERDWQSHETIVDNDAPGNGGTYTELNDKFAWEPFGTGFARLKPVYLDGENPFLDGTSRFAHVVNRKNQTSEIKWTPELPENGRYAVYVSYPTAQTSVPDAQYTVRHQGITTSFKVNQQMGGGTWVYLGTFDFDKDHPNENYVSLTNLSNYRGVVTADAVRFGGGMGNIARGDSLQVSVSGMPRYLEGARYNAQWSGMPYSIYSGKNGENDYGDDINVRSFMTNYVAGGSTYCPQDSGLHVPIELSVALHSDAGIASDGGYVGTLGIYTTDYNDGTLAAGLSRLTSRDLCDLVMTQVENDLTQIYGSWKRRQMFDRNYSETREPQVPSMILEMLSHQNFKDMVMGHDPAFKFNLARAIYKGILKYSSYQHEKDYVVQPLPVSCFQTSIDTERKEIHLSWTPRQDDLEPTARPSGYIVYTRQGEHGFDNGTFVKEPHYTLNATENTSYSFKVTAVNDGGESFPSEELSAMIVRNARANILIIDGFQRVAAPQVVLTDSTQGFDMEADPGVPYMQSPGFCGRQLVFNTQCNPSENWGYSGNELEGKMIAGNTFDHSRVHGDAIAAAGIYSFASVSRSAIETGMVDMSPYHVIDLILGLQRNDGYSLRPYPTLTPELCNAMREFVRMHGSLLVSGAYIASDRKSQEANEFLKNTLKVDAYAPRKIEETTTAEGMNTMLHLYTQPDDKHYAVTHADCLIPYAPAFSTLLYAPNQSSAAVAYQGSDYRTVVLGFPFECIKYATDRDKIMAAFLKFLIER